MDVYRCIYRERERERERRGYIYISLTILYLRFFELIQGKSISQMPYGQRVTYYPRRDVNKYVNAVSPSATHCAGRVFHRLFFRVVCDTLLASVALSKMPHLPGPSPRPRIK